MRRLEDFEGEWELSRSITHADGTLFRFAGRALFLRDGKSLLCIESGDLTGPDGRSFPGERRYRWHEGLRVTFDDGRDFHTVPPDGGAARHWCDPDRYEVDYDFTAWPHWRATWRVTGPRKDYTSVSEFRRPDGFAN